MPKVRTNGVNTLGDIYESARMDCEIWHYSCLNQLDQ